MPRAGLPPPVSLLASSGGLARRVRTRHTVTPETAAVAPCAAIECANPTATRVLPFRVTVPLGRGPSGSGGRVRPETELLDSQGIGAIGLEGHGVFESWHTACKKMKADVGIRGPASPRQARWAGLRGGRGPETRAIETQIAHLHRRRTVARDSPNTDLLQTERERAAGRRIVRGSYPSVVTTKCPFRGLKGVRGTQINRPMQSGE